MKACFARHPFLAVLVLLINFFCAQAQNEPNPNYYSYSGSIHYGALLGYKKNDPPLLFTNPFSLDLSVRKISTGKKRWERLYNYPSKVFSLGYYNYGIPLDYGEAYSATASYDFNLFRSRRKNIWLSAGFGGVYSTKKFDALSNPYNKAISSDLCYVLQGSIRYDYALNNQITLNTSFSFKHFSNATYGIPNNGMNFPLIGIGLSYQPRKPDINFAQDTLKSFEKKIHFTVSTGLAIKKVLQEDTHHKIYSFSFYADRQITKYNSIVLGLDGFYNTSIAAEFLKKGKYLPESSIDHRQLAFTFGQELFIGKIGVITQGGVFLYNPHQYATNFYQKYGWKYYITPDVFIGSIVKVYVGTADYMEWVVGGRF